ncbi:TetR/AcrR family transcriptional regulator [Phytohabitans flavus]|uniref:TetR/AcrR family transcriptional regulator n=1 Tax=Phytohabitans flavus TaxID=1076124 RepID=UPI0018D85845|nr:TetR/AcrR family transcriptional regulator [Phytohabitans flavus]
MTKLRSDTERTVRTILEAAERTFSRNPAASMEQVAEAAGVARTTVHRRFTSRDALIDAMAAWATRRFAEAVESAYTTTAPVPVTLHQVTANVLRVKIDWGYAMSRTTSRDPEVARVHSEVRGRCDEMFRRARDAGLLRADADLDWVRRVYYALIHEAATGPDEDLDADALATRLVDTLLHGFGASAGRWAM